MAREYRYEGARALVELHERHLREFFGVWRRAESAGIEMPTTDDPNYASREALLAHVLGAAGRYLIWICEKLEQPAPVFEARPPAETFVQYAAGYLECIDAMLEHAVMHPIRHAHQLRRLMDR